MILSKGRKKEKISKNHNTSGILKKEKKPNRADFMVRFIYACDPKKSTNNADFDSNVWKGG